MIHIIKLLQCHNFTNPSCSIASKAFLLYNLPGHAVAKEPRPGIYNFVTQYICSHYYVLFFLVKSGKGKLLSEIMHFYYIYMYDFYDPALAYEFLPSIASL